MVHRWFTVANDPGTPTLRLHREADPETDHVRGAWSDEAVFVVTYQDFLCPYCRRLRPVLRRLRAALGDRLVYVFRHFPNERANPGAILAARASEAASLQGRFFEMHDAIFDRELPIGRSELLELATAIGLDRRRFADDLDSAAVSARVDRDVEDGRGNGVTGTPTLFVDGLRYDGAWDYHSMLEALERPVAARVHRSARVFASLPSSGGLILLLTALLAILCANTPLAPLYERAMNAHLGIGPVGNLLSLTTREWLSEGLFTLFFLIVGLEIRREATVGALTTRRAALLPLVAALGGVVAPALVYLALNRGAAAHGWPIPTATDVAFSLALLALLGDRVPSSLRVFVAALAVSDDVLSVLTLALFFPAAFAPVYAPAVGLSLLVLFALNRARVYARWPYVLATLATWLSLHALGVDAAIAGVLVALAIPARPAPAPGPLLAQAANALAALDEAEAEAKRAKRDGLHLETEPVWEWAARNLSAAADRLLSPAERIEKAVGPWSAYVVLPLFAFSAAGVRLSVRLSSPEHLRIFAGTVLGLVGGKPIGVLVASAGAVATGLATPLEGVTLRQFIGAACLCGVGDTLALLMADRALSPDEAALAKLGVLAGSVIAGLAGTAVLAQRGTKTLTTIDRTSRD
ncbi:MAG TPA: Na+/H+ antiporter NhaA [Polyangiaceae bacterium]|nr:Na+/H+ antiporter NhaA [Polyangiaceae bacterium]